MKGCDDRCSVIVGDVEQARGMCRVLAVKEVLVVKDCVKANGSITRMRRWLSIRSSESEWSAEDDP